MTMKVTNLLLARRRTLLLLSPLLRRPFPPTPIAIATSTSTSTSAPTFGRSKTSISHGHVRGLAHPPKLLLARAFSGGKIDPNSSKPLESSYGSISGIDSACTHPRQGREESSSLSSVVVEFSDGKDFLRSELGLTEAELAVALRKSSDILKPSVIEELKSLLIGLSLPSKQSIVKAAVTDFPNLVVSRKAEQMLETVGFFDSNLKMGESTIDKLLRRNPRILTMDLEKDLKPKLDYLVDRLMIPSEKLPKVIMGYSDFLFMKVDTGLEPKIDYLRSLGLNRISISKMITRSPSVLAHSVENKMIPLVKELQDAFGPNLATIRRILVSKPTILSYKLGGSISESIKSLKQYKYNGQEMPEIFRKSFTPKGAESVTQYESLLVNHGLTQQQAKTLIGKDPRILNLPRDRLLTKLGYLTHVLGLPAQCLLQAPLYLRSDLKTRIRPRQRALSYLRLNGLLKHSLTFKAFVNLPKEVFCDLYVKPHPGAASLYYSRSLDSAATTEIVPFLKEAILKGLLKSTTRSGIVAIEASSEDISTTTKENDEASSSSSSELGLI